MTKRQLFSKLIKDENKLLNERVFRQLKGRSMFIDVHAHLCDTKFDNVAKVIENANMADVKKIISASYNFPSCEKNLEFADKFENVFVTIGIHPENVEEIDDNYLQKLKKYLKNPKVVAIGEIGLDYHWKNDNKELQKKVFIEQIQLANELDLPVVVHSRDAMGDILEILKNHPLKRESLMHCYSGSIESAKELMKLGFSFSFGGVVTFRNAKNVQEVVKNLPIEKILLETDCPYMAPEPFRGKKNEPKYIPIIAKKIAELKNMELSKIKEITTKNCEKMFKI